MKNMSKTDWSRIDAMSDEDIDTSDIPPLSEEFFAKAQLRIPQSPVKITAYSTKHSESAIALKSKLK